MKDRRGRRIIFLAHCLLNQNAKVDGLAGYRGACEPLVRLLTRAGVGIIQLPCPETTCLGLGRPMGTDTVEQYDTAKYRAVCRKLARAAVREMKAYQGAGYRILCVLGVEGSPSCSVDRAPKLVGGKRRMVRGCGLFMEALKSESVRAGLKLKFIGVPEANAAGDMKKALEQIGKATK